MTIRLGLRALRLRGLNQRHIAIVGAGTLGRTVVARLAGSPWTGFNVLAFYDDDATQDGHDRSPAGRCCRSTSGCAPTSPPAPSTRCGSRCRCARKRASAASSPCCASMRSEIRFVPDIYSFHLLNHSMTDVAGLPVISLTETPMSGINRVVKAIEDYALASVFLVARLAVHAAHRARRQAVVEGTGALPAGARHVERRAIRDAQVPHDAGRRRSRERSRVVAPRRAARHAVRRVPAPHEPRRAAAVHQRAARRDVARRARAPSVRSSSSASARRFPATCRSTS